MRTLAGHYCHNTDDLTIVSNALLATDNIEVPYILFHSRIQRGVLSGFFQEKAQHDIAKQMTSSPNTSFSGPVVLDL